MVRSVLTSEPPNPRHPPTHLTLLSPPSFFPLLSRFSFVLLHFHLSLAPSPPPSASPDSCSFHLPPRTTHSPIPSSSTSPPLSSLLLPASSPLHLHPLHTVLVIEVLLLSDNSDHCCNKFICNHRDSSSSSMFDFMSLTVSGSINA